MESLKADEERFWRLLGERAAPGADTAAIDRRLWDLFGAERAVLFTDLCGFSTTSASRGIAHFLQIIAEHRRLFYPIIDRLDGVVIKLIGDSLLIVFPRARSALHAAIEMQRSCRLYNRHRVADEQIRLAVGLGFGRVLCVGDSEVWGEEVNAASKLGEDLAKHEEILVTQSAKDALDDDGAVSFEELGISLAGSPRTFKVVYSRESASAPYNSRDETR